MLEYAHIQECVYVHVRDVGAWIYYKDVYKVIRRIRRISVKELGVCALIL